MKKFALIIALSLVLSGCSGGEEEVAGSAEDRSAEVEAAGTAEVPTGADSGEGDEVAEEIQINEPEGAGEAAEEPKQQQEAEAQDEPEANDEPEQERVAEEPEEQVNEEPEEAAPVLPVINDIEFFCRNRNLTVNVHAKIPGTQGSEGRYYWGISHITAYRKNEYNAELDHELKWDGQYDPEKDKWISAERTIAGDQTKDMIRIVVEGRDANGNNVKYETTVDHGTGC